MKVNQFKICIIDDAERSRETIRTLLAQYCTEIELAGEAGNVAEGLKLIREKNPDLILLDIEMPDGTGFDLVKNLIHNPVKVIFISAHQEYSLNALKFSAVDYILKPIDPYDLVRAIEKARGLIERDSLIARFSALLDNLNDGSKLSKKVVLKTSDAIHVVQIADIMRCEANGNYTTFYISGSKPVVVSKTLKEFDSFTEFGFIRCHQSHLVNLKFISSFKKADGGFLILTDSSKVPVSSRNRESVIRTIENL